MSRQDITEGRSGRTERLEARVSPDQKELIIRAAALEGSTLTEFVVRNLQEAARRAIMEHERMELGAQDREIFIAALLNPPEPNERLRQASERYRTLKEV